MNMKKTIAAIAAGAVAVSAMATTVSALEARTLTYNLVKTTKKQDAKGTVTATFTNVPLQAGGKLIVTPKSDFGAHSWDTMVTISGSFWDDEAGTNKSFVPVVATGMNWETGYSIEGSKLWNDTKVEVPVVAGTAQGTNVALKASSSAVLTVTVKFANLPDSVSYVGALNELIRDGKVGIQIQSTAAGVSAGADSHVTYTSNGRVNTFSYLDAATQTKVNNAVGAEGFNAEYTTKWVQAGVAPTFTVGSVTEVTPSGITTADIKISGITKPGTYTNAQCNNTFTLVSDGAGTWTDQYGEDWTGITYDNILTGATAASGDKVVITGSNGVNQGTAEITAATAVAAALNIVGSAGDTLSAPGYAGGAAGSALYTSDLSGAATETSGNSEKKAPYWSTLKNSIYSGQFEIGGTIGYNRTAAGGAGSGEVFSWIGYANSDSDEGKINATSIQVTDAARSVINDAVQNYNDVVFTFNTATSNVVISYNKDGSIKDYEYTSDDAKARWDDNGTYKEIINYTAFGRHFWDRDTGYDTNTVYINNEWLGNNLFEGALIINNNITLSLGATDKFDWTATSLSFSWDAIQDASLTQNQYANYIQNMVLRTSTDWFWDNMTVALGETETEEVDSGAPVEGNTEDLDEDEDLGGDEDEDFDFGGDEDEDPDVDTTPDPEPEPTPVVASNPSTGNAPVALAVIPVALAAAAIVAKKRG